MTSLLSLPKKIIQGAVFLLLSSGFIFGQAASRPVAPREQGFLQVSKIHEIFYATYGNPAGIPVVVVHGGPGLGSSDKVLPFFTPEQFNIIVFDQRGAGQSKPHACMEENTTQDLIEDMEKLRTHLGINKWIVFGSSWGALLSILYGEKHPQSCQGFILVSTFLGRQEDIHLFGDENDAPEAYEEFITHLPQGSDLFNDTYRLIMDSDPAIHMDIARAFVRYHLTRTNIRPLDADLLERIINNDALVLGATRALFHYTAHNLFIRHNQALEDLSAIAHLPVVIVHGEEDINCPVEQAITLHNQWPNSTLITVKKAEHAWQEDLNNATIYAITMLTTKL